MSMDTGTVAEDIAGWISPFSVTDVDTRGASSLFETAITKDNKRLGISHGCLCHQTQAPAEEATVHWKAKPRERKPEMEGVLTKNLLELWILLVLTPHDLPSLGRD